MARRLFVEEPLLADMARRRCQHASVVLAGDDLIRLRANTEPSKGRPLMAGADKLAHQRHQLVAGYATAGQRFDVGSTLNQSESPAMNHILPHIAPVPHACPTILQAAAAAGQGKITVVAALARRHAQQGRKVRVFK